MYFDQARLDAVPKIPEIQALLHAHEVVTSKPVRCYCLSDLHADTERNQAWVREKAVRLEQDEEFFTVILIPGDIGSEIDKIESVLHVLVKNYDAVAYIPGNHEAWKRGTKAGGEEI